MSEYIKSVENICSTIQLATGLGHDPQKVGDNYTIECPCCHNRLFILKGGFLCENSTCTFRAGGIYDLIMESENIKSYDQALKYLEVIFPNLFSEQIFLNDSKVKQQIVKHLSVRRKLYNLLLQQGRQEIDDQHTLSIHNKLRRASDLDNISSPYCLFPLSKQHYDELADILSMYGHPAPDFKDSKPILIPYFTNHHTVSVLGYKHSIRSQTHFIKLESCKFQYCGLMQADPRIKTFTLVPTYAKILSKNDEFLNTDPSNLALHLLRDKSSDKDPLWVPEKVVYVEQNVNEWHNLLMFSQYSEVLVANSSHLNDTPVPLQKKIINHIFSRLLKVGIDKDVEVLLEQGQLLKDFVPNLRKKLEREEQWESLRDINRFLSCKVLDISPDW